MAVNGHPTSFKLDSGASVNIVGSDMNWLANEELDSPSRHFTGPGGVPLNDLMERKNFKCSSKSGES